MPICRYQIRGDYGSADPELYRAADRDDPEAILEGVAMAGLVGVLRKLGDLAEFAAEIFHDLHEEVMATAARGHGLMLRVQQLEEEFPSIENFFLSETSHSQFVTNAGLEWHANLRMDQNLVASGDLPRFVMDSYEECRGPPRLFLLDKFDIAGAGACLKRYSDPSFFKMEFASSGKRKVDAQREKKIRKIKRKGMRYKIGDTPDLFSASEISSAMRDVRTNEPSNVSGKNTMHGVKLKRRNLIDSSFNSIKRNYMEQIFKIPSPEQKPVYERSLVHSSWRRDSSDSSEHHTEVYEIRPVDSPMEQIQMERTDLITMLPTRNYGHELAKGDSLHGPLELVNESETMVDVSTFPAFSPKDVVVDGYKSDGNTSEMENFMDALTTMESELETDSENRLKHEMRILSIPNQAMDSDTNDEQMELQAHLSDSHSVGNSSASYEWNKTFKKKGSSRSNSDTLSSVEEPLPSSAICYDEIHDLSSKRILTDVDFAEDNPSSKHVQSKNDKLNVPIQAPNETSPGFCSGDSTSGHALISPSLLDSPQISSTSGEDHSVEPSPSSGEVGQDMIVSRQNLSSMSSLIHSTVEETHTLGFDGVAPGKADSIKISCDGDSEGKNIEILDLSVKLENTTIHDKGPSSHFEDNVSANLVSRLPDSGSLIGEMTEHNQQLVEEKPDVSLAKDASHQDYILLSLPHISPINVKPHELDMLAMDDVFPSKKSEISMNYMEMKQNTSMIELEEVPEPAVVDFNPNPSSIKGKDSDPMLADTSTPMDVYEITGGLETVDNPCTQRKNHKPDLCAVSVASVSVMHGKPDNLASVDTHKTVGTDKYGAGVVVASESSSSEMHERSDKTAVHCFPLQTDTGDCKPNFDSTSVVSAGHKVSSDECLRETASDQHKLDLSELSSLESSRSYINAVDPSMTLSSDTAVDQNKVEEVATSDAVKQGPDDTVVDHPLVIMHDSRNPNSDSEFVDCPPQPAPIGDDQSDMHLINALETPMSLTKTFQEMETEFYQHSGPFGSITNAPDTVYEPETGKEDSIVSSQEQSVDSEKNVASPTRLQMFLKVLPEQESGAPRSESMREVGLESSNEVGKIFKCSEEISQIPNAEPFNQMPKGEYFDSISDNHFEDSDFLHQPDTDSEACQLSQEAVIAEGSKFPYHEEIHESSQGTDQISGPHLSHENPHDNLEGTEETNQISELRMSDEDPHENVTDAIPPSIHFFQVKKQIVENGDIANFSVLESKTTGTLAGTVFEQSSNGNLHDDTSPKISPSIGFQEVSEQTSDDLKAKSPEHESEIAHYLTEIIPEHLKQLDSSDMVPNLGLPDVKSATQLSSDLNEVPPLPPLPPLQWRAGKLGQGSGSWADVDSSLSFLPPLGISEDSRSHSSQTSAEDPFQSENPFVAVPTTKEADNADQGVISFNSFMPPLIDLGKDQDELLGAGTLHPSNPFASLGFEEPQYDSNPTGEVSVPVVQLTQATADEKPEEGLVSFDGDVGPAVNPYASTSIEENGRPRSRMVLPRRKDPLIEAVAAHDRSKLRKVSDRVRSEIKPKMDDRNSLLEQIRTKSFNLKPAGPTRPIIQGPKTNLNVVAILEKANAIRQALAGSDDDDEEEDSWSDSC